MMCGYMSKCVALPYAQHYLDLLAQLLRSRPVALVDHIQLGDLHDAGLQRLDAVTRFGDEDQNGRLGGRGDVELGLADADGLDQNAVKSECPEHVRYFFGRRGEAALCTPRCHRSDEHAGIETH